MPVVDQIYEETLNVSKDTWILNHKQVLIVASVHETTVQRQIEKVEKRIKGKCPVYIKDNVYWTKVDDLLQEQSKGVIQVKEHPE